MKLFKNIKMGLKTHKNDIKFYGGVACIVAGTAAAVWGAFKSKDEIEKLQDELDEIKEIAPEEEVNEHVTKAYIKTGAKVALYFTPAVALEAIGIKGITDVHRDLKLEAATLTSALSANMKDFKDYRKRVVDKEGKDADLEYMYGVKNREVVEVVSDEEGEIEVNKTIPVIDEEFKLREFSKIFDDGCKGWTKDPEVNMHYLMHLQAMFTDKLRQDGFVVFNDILNALGFSRTSIGCKAGWVLGQGDNFIDFGIHEVYKHGKFDEAKCRFINGYEPSILLDFNITCADITPYINEGRRKAAKLEYV